MGDTARKDALEQKGADRLGYVCAWLKSAQCLVYSSQFLSAWRGRMWMFATSMFLIHISPQSLQLTATYGLTTGAATLLLAPVIGDWVDRNPRLRAARVTLFIQSWSVIGCSALVCLLVTFRDWVDPIWDGWLLIICQGAIIFVAVVAYLARLGNRISVQRDWVVEICDRDRDKLATMGANLRRIDLLTKIIAPIVTGQIMTFASLMISGVFIAGWNFFSWFGEHYLLGKVYECTPALAKPKLEDSNDPNIEMVVIYSQGNENTEFDAGVNGTPASQQVSPRQRKGDDGPTRVAEDSNRCENCAKNFKLFGAFFVVLKGWKVYVKYRVALAGVALGWLYLTVLGFDNITSGYAFSQGLSESLLGILMGGGALIGIIGTFAFTRIRRRVGLERTGLFSFSAQLACLLLCVASIWSPGSPFDPIGRREKQEANATLCSSSAAEITTVMSLGNKDDMNNHSSSKTLDVSSFTAQNQTNATGAVVCPDEPAKVYVAVAVLMTGIITARFGLWITDLSITQLFLENVDEMERGVFNGVQTSLNQIMDFLKFALVVAVPQLELFGFLILVSFAAVSTGGIFYSCYVRKAIGRQSDSNKWPRCC